MRAQFEGEEQINVYYQYFQRRVQHFYFKDKL